MFSNLHQRLVILTPSSKQIYKQIQKIRSGEGAGPDNVSIVINIFHRGTYGPPLSSNWTRGVQLPLEWGPYKNF